MKNKKSDTTQNPTHSQPNERATYGDKAMTILIGGGFLLFMHFSAINNFFERDYDAGLFQLVSSFLTLIAITTVLHKRKVAAAISNDSTDKQVRGKRRAATITKLFIFLILLFVVLHLAVNAVVGILQADFIPAFIVLAVAAAFFFLLAWFCKAKRMDEIL